MNQVSCLHSEYDSLQLRYGDPTLSSVYGAGCIDSPRVMFVFMNPTGRNVSASVSWKGIKAPWLGTKQVWDIFHKLGLLDCDIYKSIREMKANEWDEDFCSALYEDIARRGIYITNLAKCTQLDARALKDSVFKEYLELMFREIDIVKPKKIVTFGNQVSSILLGKNISVSKYLNLESENVNGYSVYPTYYPVGQGRRNMDISISRIMKVMNEGE
ncbi:hypothetical protein GYA44_00995 [Candidatus Microgenomates bacterium]|nr:hypothetical protein [Candidatus Microgenomates bacterium]